MKRTANAVWEGSLAHGQGHLTTASHVLHDARYSFATRFGDEAGTNSEELIAAAHAGCFSMALAYILGAAGLTPQRLETTAEVTVARDGELWVIPRIHLHLTARIPGIGEADFQRAAERAKATCLVSRLLNTSVTLEAHLEPDAAELGALGGRPESIGAAAPIDAQI